jgi:hypothetical protein
MWLQVTYFSVVYRGKMWETSQCSPRGLLHYTVGYPYSETLQLPREKNEEALYCYCGKLLRDFVK